jgi:hypothetical protein
VAFALTCCCAIGAAWLFASACEAELSRRAAVARAAGGAAAVLVAVFSMGSGILLVPAIAVLLWLRRAPSVVWAVFVVCAVLVLDIDGTARITEHAAPMSPVMSAFMPSGLALIERRSLYSATFLGNALAVLPQAAPWIGFAGYGALLALGAFAVRRRLHGGSAMIAADAALLALAVFAALCGPAASLTPRILMGAEAALVPRYATMSLLFWAACGGLVLRRLNNIWPDAAWPRGAVVTAVAGLLYLVNLPNYASGADDMQRTIAAEDGLLANNVGVEGPRRVIIFGGIPAVRDAVGFLHREGLNIFAPGQGPPAELLARLSAAPAGSLAVCRGSLDRAVAIDSGAVLLEGWVADPSGKVTAPWVAARDEKGGIVGAARSLQARADLDGAAGFDPGAFGFFGGFRDGAEGMRRLTVAGIFPGRAVPVCVLPQAAEISGVLVQPLAELGEMRPASLADAAGGGSGFVAGMGGAPPDARVVRPVARAAGVGSAGEVDFVVEAGGAALALPFWSEPGAGGKSVAFVMGDGARLTAPLAPWFGWSVWQAAVLPAALARLHGGAVRVEVRDAGGGALTVAAPMAAAERAGWSRLF